MAVAHRLPRAARPWVYLGLVGLVAIAIAVSAVWYGRAHNAAVAGTFTPDAGVSTVSYHGQTYLADTERLRLPDAQMVALGQTQEGYTVYAQRANAGYGGGGGGGAIVPPKGSVTPGPAYLKAVDGRFIPLVPE